MRLRIILLLRHHLGTDYNWETGNWERLVRVVFLGGCPKGIDICFGNDDGFNMSLGRGLGSGSWFFPACLVSSFVVRCIAMESELRWNESKW